MALWGERSPDAPGASLTRVQGLTDGEATTQALRRDWLCRSAARHPRACPRLLAPGDSAFLKLMKPGCSQHGVFQTVGLTEPAQVPLDCSPCCLSSGWLRLP